MRWSAGLLLVPALAHGDDGIELRARTEQPPILVLDPTLTSRFESIHADEDEVHAVLPVGRGVDVILDNTTWSNPEIVERGWRTAAGLTRDFGVARLTAMASYNRVDGWLGGGRYVDLSIALSRTFKLSRWMTAWISLSISVRNWTGTPPPGERNGAAAMLSVGTTFR